MPEPRREKGVAQYKYAYYIDAMETLPFEIGETAHVLRKAFDRLAVGLGVTRAQWKVLFRLTRTPGLRQVELADMLDLEPITLCRIVDRLEEAGLVERRQRVDRRRASEAGHRLGQPAGGGAGAAGVRQERQPGEARRFAVQDRSRAVPGGARECRGAARFCSPSDIGPADAGVRNRRGYRRRASQSANQAECARPPVGSAQAG